MTEINIVLNKPKAGLKLCDRNLLRETAKFCEKGDVSQKMFNKCVIQAYLNMFRKVSPWLTTL